MWQTWREGLGARYYHDSAAQSLLLSSAAGATSGISGRRTMLNRGVVIVRPKQPYLDWAAGLDDSELVPDPNAEQTVYLIPSYSDDEEAWEILERVHPAIFENELYG